MDKPTGKNKKAGECKVFRRSLDNSNHTYAHPSIRWIFWIIGIPVDYKSRIP